MIDRGQTRPVTVEASPVTEAGYSTFSDGTASNTITASTVENATASDEKRATNYQRVRVTFTTDGSPVNFTVRAGDGDAKVWVEDLRVVEWAAPTDGDATDETIYFQDFENVDVGYFPFVTGYTNRGGDARTQLAERHEPYSQKGWWGINPQGDPQEDFKLNDNVLEGTWSLMANNENTGEILKTAPGAINFEAGRKYRVSFDYQTTYADQYRVRLGHDVVTGDGSTAVNTVSDVLGEERNTTRWSTDFDASSCGVPFIAVDKLAGPNTQHNMTIDNLRVEEIGDADSEACLSGGITSDSAVVAGDDVTVSTTVTAYNDAVTDVNHELDIPDGWTSSVATAGATDLAFGETSTQVWTVTTPADITEVMEERLVFTGSGTVEGNESSVTDSAMVRVILPPEPGENYLSDLRSNLVGTPTNGWGPVEWDTANGENNAGDGPPLTLGGEVFPKGIGAHAPSTIDYDLSALECTRFQATVGVDDSRGGGGSVQFAVYGDGELIGEQTDVLSGGDTPVELDMDITGVETLSLRITDGGDGNGSDHGNWAGARVTCGDDSTTPPTTTPPTAAPTTPPSTPVLEYPAKLYQSPGYHNYNGRRWFTKCEPYSATVRCWTSIWSTQVTVQGGQFVSKTGWFHNNLTYLPSDRSTWKGNPLGFTNKWTTSDGRNWYTECDTPATGRNGCRSYLRTDGVVEAIAQPGGGYSYRVVSKWVFNNIVLFN